jgi:hypothetical protein
MEVLEAVRQVLNNRTSPVPQNGIETDTPHGRVRVHLKQGQLVDGQPIKLVFRSSALPKTPVPSSQSNCLHEVALPSPDMEALGERLVGLDTIRDSVLLDMMCRWGDHIQQWSEKVQHPIPQSLEARFQQRIPLYVFVGDPGVGKSALAQVVCDRYCRYAKMSGRLLRLSTTVRRDHVGDTSKMIRQAFLQVRERRSDEFICLLIDEADAIAMRRSEGQAHHEDRATVATLLQCLDELQGETHIAVIMTSNLLQNLDPAILRRGLEFNFPRPDSAVRYALLKQWLPHFSKWELFETSLRTRAMTPADIERSLTLSYMQALAENAPLTLKRVRQSLQRAARTRSV